VIMSGNYAERVIVSRGGLTFEGHNATIQGFTISADDVSVKGFYITNTTGDEYGFYVSSSNCVIENNYVYYAVRGGLILTPTSANCLVRNNKFERNSQLGMEIAGTNHVIVENEIWGSIQYHPQWLNPPTWVDADGIRFFGSGHVFRENYIHDILYAIPENINPHIDCFQTWTDNYHIAGTNILFEGNTCVNTDAQTSAEIGQGFMLGGGTQAEGGTGNITIRNNIIKAYRGLDASHSDNLIIINNVFTSGPVINELNQYGLFITDSNDALAQNNIFYNIIGDSCNIYGVPSKGNMFYIRPEAGHLRCSPATGDLWQVDPLFVDPGAGDYNLQPRSPAIGTGVGGVNFGAYGLPTP